MRTIMMIGDICGRPGRQAVAEYLPGLKKEYAIDMVIANVENAAGGVGITQPILHELFTAGIDFATTGNHVWDKKEIFDFIDDEPNLIRPANYPPGTPGRGYHSIDCNGALLGIINLAGRVFMPPVDCPFQTVDALLAGYREQCSMILVDFHAEATSEKLALAWYLDGKVSCVVGTHTHIQTADEQILPQGTAYITDVGMTGPTQSILGVEVDTIIKKFKTGLPTRFNVATGAYALNAVVVQIDEETGQALSIKRLQIHS